MVRDVGRLDELDLALLHALQVDPRAAWAQVGDTVGVDAATAARRWSRLAAQGVAWLTVDPGTPRPGRMVVAFVEVACAADQIMPTATQLAHDPRVASVEHVTGGRDLLLTVFTASMAGLADFLSRGMAAVPGVRTTRSQLATRMATEGSKWRLRALDPAQRSRIGRGEVGGPAADPLLPDPELRRLLGLLTEDPRIPISDLAARLGVSRPTARRRLGAALATRQIVLRCDISRAAVGALVPVNLWTSVAPAEHAAAAQALARMPETRLAAGITGGPSNLLLALWLPSLDDLPRLEIVLAERLPRLQIVDRAIVVRSIKRIGRHLDGDGFGTGSACLDPWASEPPAQPR